jgi:hypothetical protein
MLNLKYSRIETFLRLNLKRNRINLYNIKLEMLTNWNISNVGLEMLTNLMFRRIVKYVGGSVQSSRRRQMTFVFFYFSMKWSKKWILKWQVGAANRIFELTKRGTCKGPIPTTVYPPWLFSFSFSIGLWSESAIHHQNTNPQIFSITYATVPGDYNCLDTLIRASLIILCRKFYFFRSCFRYV